MRSHELLANHLRFDASFFSLPYYSSLVGAVRAKNRMSGLIVGCSLGRSTAALAFQVGREGSVLALDDDKTVVKYARSNQGRERQKALGWSLPSDSGNGCVLKGEACVPRFETVASFCNLRGCEDGAFDCVVADRVQQRPEHNQPLECVIQELARVTAPGGRLSVGVVDDRATSGEDPHRWLARPSSSFEADELAALMSAAGIQDVLLAAVQLPPSTERDADGLRLFSCSGVAAM